MGSLAQSRRFAVSAHALAGHARLFAADRADEEETAATIRTSLRETGYCVDPHTAVALAVAEKEAARSGDADGRAVDRASGQIPAKRLRRPAAHVRRCRIGSPTSTTAGARHRAAGRSGGGRTIRIVGVARGA